MKGVSALPLRARPVICLVQTWRIARQTWDERDDFVCRSAPFVEPVARAASLACGAAKPVLLLDHGDNCMSGGTCDTMDLFWKALKQGLEGIVSGPLCDPPTVAALAALDVGSTVTLTIGNKLTNDALPARSPLAVTGVVRALTDGDYLISAPTYTGAVKPVVTERTHEPWDLGMFESVGIDPRGARFPLLHEFGLWSVQLPTREAAGLSIGPTHRTGHDEPIKTHAFGIDRGKACALHDESL